MLLCKKICVLLFRITIVWNISPSVNWARCDQNCILVFRQSACCCCHIVMKLVFSRQSSEKYSNAEFPGSPFSGSIVVPCRRIDWRDEANSYYSQICGSVQYRCLYSATFDAVLTSWQCGYTGRSYWIGFYPSFPSVSDLLLQILEDLW